MKICFMYCRRETEREKLIKTTIKIIGITSTLIAINGALPSLVYASGADTAVNNSNSVGFEVWKVIKTGAMWIMAGFAVKDILESLNDGDYRAIGKIMFKYGLAFAAIACMIKYFLWIDRLSQR